MLAIIIFFVRSLRQHSQRHPLTYCHSVTNPIQLQQFFDHAKILLQNNVVLFKIAKLCYILTQEGKTLNLQMATITKGV